MSPRSLLPGNTEDGSAQLLTLTVIWSHFHSYSVSFFLHRGNWAIWGKKLASLQCFWVHCQIPPDLLSEQPPDSVCLAVRLMEEGQGWGNPWGLRSVTGHLWEGSQGWGSPLGLL